MVTKKKKKKRRPNRWRGVGLGVSCLVFGGFRVGVQGVGFGADSLSLYGLWFQVPGSLGVGVGIPGRLARTVALPPRPPHPGVCGRNSATRKVDARLPGKGNSNSHGARPVHLIITMIKWIRTSRLSIKNSLSLWRVWDAGLKILRVVMLGPRPRM